MRLFTASALACAAVAVFAAGLSSEPFVDEYAYITQSYYADLLFQGKVNHPYWLGLPAYDLPPLPKYLIGLALRVRGLPMPGPYDARLWYDHYRQFGPPEVLTTARIPIIVLGAVGCVAIYACGTLVESELMGAIAAILLMLNPLYRLHAHRAMSDVPAESFMLVALALELWAWKRIWLGPNRLLSWILPVAAGLAAGLALLSKFNGFLALLVVSAWAAAAIIAPTLGWAKKLSILAGAVVTIAAALALFVALDPYMTARPRGLLNPETRAIADLNLVERFRKLIDHRLMVSSYQQKSFDHNALVTLPEKTKVFAVQGFGRFGPFGPAGSDSTVRFALDQDWGVVAWAPLVILGIFQSWRLARAQWATGQPPTAAALLIWTTLTWLVVTVYLPMAWDRYLMPIQSVNALVAAFALRAIIAWITVRVAPARQRT